MVILKPVLSKTVLALLIITSLIAGCSNNNDDNPAGPVTVWSWKPMGAGMDYHLYALTVYDSLLVAGGIFNQAGEVDANYVAAWDDSAWTALGTGTDYNVYGC